MSLIAWIVIGLIAGGTANWAMKGGFGLIGSIVLGIIGAIVGGFIGNLLFGGGDINTIGSTDVNSINIWTIIFSIFGAILVVGFTKVVMGRGGD